MAKKLRTILPATDMAIGRFHGQSIFWKPGPEGWSHGAGQVTNEFGVDRAHWKVPKGARIATFEIWGGGGNGAGARCCQQGIPGGSGAYAYKTIKVTPGDYYIMCNPINKHCCYYSENNHQCGYRGGKAYVTGNGLTNFCAEGGNPGISCCWFFLSYRHNEYMYMCDLLGRRVGESDSDPYRIARYYGTENGACGSHSWAQIGCCGTWQGAHACGIKTGLAFPGGWHMFGRAAKGGVHHKGLMYYCQCFMDIHDGASGRLAHSTLGGAWYSRMPGEGGLSAATYAGPCCCGGQGAFGAVRITWDGDSSGKGPMGAIQ